MKKTCKHCGTLYIPNDDESICSTPICDDCFEEMEYSNVQEIYEFSDADMGL